MKQINHNLYIGTVAEVPPFVLQPEEWSIVNVANTFHNTLHNWKKANPMHKCYVIHQEEHLFSLNWVDGPKQYFDYQGKGVENTNQMLRFIQQALQNGKNVLLCCNQGLSRSPSVGMIYLDRIGLLGDNGYEISKHEFVTHYYPEYQPSEGIEEFMRENWGRFSL